METEFRRNVSTSFEVSISSVLWKGARIVGIESECAHPPSISYSRYSRVTVTWLCTLPYIHSVTKIKEMSAHAPREPVLTSTLRVREKPR